MNWVKVNREHLNQHNYVLKANTNSGYWFGIWYKKLNSYSARFNSDFNIILFGSEDIDGDFYVIPYSSIQDLLTEDTLYSFDVGKRWVGDIHHHILKFRNSTIERNISEFYSLPQTSNDSPVLQKNNKNDYAIENAKREIQIRIKQSTFRKKVLENFNYQCCLTGVKEKELLVASHIIPWSAKLETRLSPHNGLCLTALYDNLFDKGFFSLTDNLTVIITTKFDNLSSQTQNWLDSIRGKTIILPLRYEISATSLAYHRDFIYDSFFKDEILR